MQLTQGQVHSFTETLWSFCARNGRHDLPWRQPSQSGFSGYAVLVSEIMLQQTQVARVIPKYNAFLQAFPTVQRLAVAELGEVLVLWQGLGYNRRAKYLWQAAQTLCTIPEPWSVDALMACKGVGCNTAGAVVTYAYNQRAVFIETNIRTVYIHHFFADSAGVDDRDIAAAVGQALPDSESYREFYWALMDYGSYLKVSVGNASKASKHYARQSTFAGSRRQVRGAVVRTLTTGPQTQAELQAVITDERLQTVLQDLLQEGLVRFEAGVYRI